MLQRQTHWRCQEVFLWCARCCASASARCGARDRLSGRCITQREHTRNAESDRTTQENEFICMSLCLEHRTKQNENGSKRLSFVSVEFCTLMCCLCGMSQGVRVLQSRPPASLFGHLSVGQVPPTAKSALMPMGPSVRLIGQAREDTESQSTTEDIERSGVPQS